MFEIKRKFIVLIIVFLSICINIFAGWTRTYGGNNHDIGNSVQQTTDEGYIIAGYTESYGAGARDVYLIKTNSNGDNIWTKIFGGTYNDIGNSVQQTTDGGYIIAGSTSSYGAGEVDVYLIKTNNNGDSLWTRTFGGPKWDLGNSVQQTTDGGYIIAGRSESYGADSFDVYLIKTNSSGDTLWTRTYGGNGYYSGNSIQQTTDGGYIIAGWYSMNLIKTNSNGDIIWTRTYGEFGFEKGNSVQQTTDGGYIITGYFYSAGNYDVHLIKTNSSGDTLWTRTYGGSGRDEGYSVQQTTDGGYIVAGSTSSYGAGLFDVYLIKTDSNGDSLWTRTYGGTGTDQGYSIQQTSDGGYIIVGYFRDYGAGTDDVYLIKTDENGLAVEETIISTPTKFSYSINQISNNDVSLQFSLPTNDNIELNIYDAAGRYISTPISGNYSVGMHTVNFKTENCGIYFFNLRSNEISENGKFIVF